MVSQPDLTRYSFEQMWNGGRRPKLVHWPAGFTKASKVLVSDWSDRLRVHIERDGHTRYSDHLADMILDEIYPGRWPRVSVPR